MKLTAQNDSEIVTDCLSREQGELSESEAQQIRETNTAPAGWIIVEGVTRRFLFNLERVEKHREEIGEMLRQLPEQFQPNGGGGWSFLNACMTINGEQWGDHRDIDDLLCLGLATKQAAILMPKSMWSALPGGMPYFGVYK